MRIIVSFLIIYLVIFGSNLYANEAETIEDGLLKIVEGFKGDNLESFIKERGLFKYHATKEYINNKIPKIKRRPHS